MKHLGSSLVQNELVLIWDAAQAASKQLNPPTTSPSTGTSVATARGARLAQRHRSRYRALGTCLPDPVGDLRHLGGLRTRAHPLAHAESGTDGAPILALIVELDEEVATEHGLGHNLHALLLLKAAKHNV